MLLISRSVNIVISRFASRQTRAKSGAPAPVYVSSFGFVSFNRKCARLPGSGRECMNVHIAELPCRNQGYRIYLVLQLAPALTLFKGLNRVCKIIGTDILLLYEAILDLVSLTSIQIVSLEVVFAYPF